MSPALAIQRALDAIEAQLMQPLTVAALARRAGMSPWHFQRTFGVLAGTTVGAYLRGRRLTEAARRLRAGPGTILALALDCQFESHEAFTRAFQAQFVYSPSAWRRGRGPLNHPVEPIVLGPRPLGHFRMKLNPEFVTVPARTYVGLQAPFIMVISPDANNMAIIPKLWRDFMARREEVPVGPRGRLTTYGLSQSPESAGLARHHPDEAVYLAAVELPRGAKVPPGMVTWKVPARRYARFVHRGPVPAVGKTYAAIYGQWLGAGEHRRGRGPDIERYGEKFCPEEAKSEFDILVPVAARRPTGPAKTKQG